MITITEIGIVAGDIWQYLDKTGNATLDQIVRETKKPRELILMSLGWLAREGHITLEGPDSGYRATLTQKKRI